MSNALVDKDVLNTLIGCAETHIDDVNSGIEEGLYDAEENTDIGDKEAAIKAAQDAISTSSIYPYLDCSTGHLMTNTLKELDNTSLFDGVTVANYEYGAFVSVPPVDVSIDEEHGGMPEDLRIVLKFAQARGCHIVRFDSDGDEVEGLPKYDHA